MKPKIAMGIPGRKAKESAAGMKRAGGAPETPGGEDGTAKAAPPETREQFEDRNRKSEARKEMDARVRAKLKNSRKR